MSMFKPGVSIAVVDVETTGLFPQQNDRVIEIAAVVIEPDGRVLREYSTLVNPERDVGPTKIHGITASDVRQAPKFREIAASLLDVLDGSVAIAAHNVRFDRQFLQSEFARLGSAFPDAPSFCTLEMGGRSTLAKCCQEHGVQLDGRFHSALVDARAAARLLTVLLDRQPRRIGELSGLGPIKWPSVPRSKAQPLTREGFRLKPNETPSFVQRLLSRMSYRGSTPSTDGPMVAYEAFLDRVLEDRVLDKTEIKGLYQTALQWGLSADQVRSLHSEYVRNLAWAAVEDEVITDAERTDLAIVAKLLGVDSSVYSKLLNRDLGTALVTAAPAPEGKLLLSELAGKRICFTGESQCTINGYPISRDQAVQLVTAAGVNVAKNVSRKVDLIIAADPETESGKAKKAREYGIPIFPERTLWEALGLKVR